MSDASSGSHAGNTADTSGVGSSAGKFEVGLPEFPNVPPTFGAPSPVPTQDAPDRPDLLHIGVDKDPAGGPLTTSSASSLLAGHGAHHIRPRTRHTG